MLDFFNDETARSYHLLHTVRFAFLAKIQIVQIMTETRAFWDKVVIALYFVSPWFLFYIELYRIYMYIAKSQSHVAADLPISFVSLSECVPNTAPTRYDNDNVSLIA